MLPRTVAPPMPRHQPKTRSTHGLSRLESSQAPEFKQIVLHLAIETQNLAPKTSSTGPRAKIRSAPTRNCATLTPLTTPHSQRRSLQARSTTHARTQKSSSQSHPRGKLPHLMPSVPSSQVAKEKTTVHFLMKPLAPKSSRCKSLSSMNSLPPQ